MLLIKIIIRDLSSCHFLTVKTDSSSKRFQRSPVINLIPCVYPDSREHRVYTVIGQNTKRILLYAVCKILASAVFNQLHKGHIRSFNISVINLKHIKVIYISVIAAIAVPVIRGMLIVHFLRIGPLPASGIRISFLHVFINSNRIHIVLVVNGIGIKLHLRLISPCMKRDCNQSIAFCTCRRLP